MLIIQLPQGRENELRSSIINQEAEKLLQEHVTIGNLKRLLYQNESCKYGQRRAYMNS